MRGKKKKKGSTGQAEQTAVAAGKEKQQQQTSKVKAEVKGKTRKWSASPLRKRIAQELQNSRYYDYHKLKKNNNEAWRWME